MLRHQCATHPDCVVNSWYIIAGFVFPRLSVCDWPQCGEISISYFLFLLDHIRPHNPLQIPPSLQDPAWPSPPTLPAVKYNMECQNFISWITFISAHDVVEFKQINLIIIQNHAQTQTKYHYHLKVQSPNSFSIHLMLPELLRPHICRWCLRPCRPVCQARVMDDPPWPRLLTPEHASKNTKGTILQVRLLLPA